MDDVKDEQVFRPRMWGAIAIANALFRASSYQARPPTGFPSSPGSRGFTQPLFNFETWSFVFYAVAVFCIAGIVTAHVNQNRVWFFAHVFSLLAYATLGFNMLPYVFMDRQGWANIWPIFAAAILHIGMAKAIGPHTGWTFRWGSKREDS